MLTSLFAHPLLYLVSLLAGGLFVSVCIPNKHVVFVRLIALSVSGLALLLGVVRCLVFDKSRPGFQFVAELPLL